MMANPTSKRLGRLLIVLFWAAPLTGLGKAGAETVVSTSELTSRPAAYDRGVRDPEETLDVSAVTWEKPADPTCFCQPDCVCSSPVWNLSIDYLNWKPHRSDLGFAILDPSGTGVPSAGQPVLALDYDRDSGVRLALGRRLASDWTLSFQYTSFAAADRQNFAPGGGQVLALMSSPATGLTNADSAVGSVALDMDLFDLEAGRWVQPCESMLVRMFAGVRFAQIDQDLEVQYDGGAFTNGSVSAPVDFFGFGGRVGGETHWLVTDRFRLFGSLGVSLLSGEYEARRLEQNAGTVVIDATHNFDQIVPVLEMSIGGALRRGPWTFAGGYELSNWFNLVAPIDFADSFNGGSLDDGNRDLGFSGFFVRAIYER